MIVNYDGKHFKRIFFTPSNMREINRYFPNIFNYPGEGTDPEDTELIVGAVRLGSGNKWRGNYQTYGYGGNSQDQLKRVDTSVDRIAAYIYAPNKAINPDTGNNEPYIDIECVSGTDDTPYPYLNDGDGGHEVNCLGITDFGIRITDTIDYTDGYTNLKTLNNDWYATSGADHTDPEDATWENDNIVSLAGHMNNPTIGFTCGTRSAWAESLYITGKIPVFLTPEAAKAYIENGTISATTCFNAASMFNDDVHKNWYITSQTYEYDKNQVKVDADSSFHTLYIDAGSHVVKGYVNEGDYYNIKLKCYGDTSDTSTVRYTSGGVPTSTTMTVADFNNSRYATDFNTWKDFQYYGRSGFVKGNGFGTNIYIYASENDADASVEHPETHIPINRDDIFDSINHDDTGQPCNTEDDLISVTHDGTTGLITLYESPAGSLANLGTELYNPSTSLLDSLKIYGESPINSLISVHHCPIDISNFIVKEPVSAFKVGSHDVTASGLNRIKTYGKIATLGSTLINPTYGDFRDYDNFEYELHLPFSNPISLDPREIMGKTLTLKATVDPFNLQIRYYIIVNSVVYKTVDTSFGTQIAVVGNDAAGKAREMRQDIMSLTGNAIGIATGVASGNPVLTANNVMGAVGGIYSTLEAEKREPKKTVVGAMAPGCAENDILYPYLTIIETLSIKPPLLESTYGRPTNLITKLSNLHGFVSAEMPMIEVNCTEAERDEIIAAIAEGIII